ncbi:MAG: exosortase-associated protein EpsI, B-type [Methylophilaceae bacterium]
MKQLTRNSIIAVLMLTSSAMAMVLRPTHKIVDAESTVNLETMIPKQFGDWQEQPQNSGQIINPQQQEMLDKIYTQLLSRTYTNTKGERIMLSIAYGADQSDSKQLHYPEVCYPAQGFQVVSTSLGLVKTDFGNIRVKRLLTVMGNRSEPLTYWTTVGNKVVQGSREAKIEQLRYGFRGEIPDGLLFRVSSITADAEKGYASQEAFSQALIAPLAEKDRLKLAGLTAPTPSVARP